MKRFFTASAAVGLALSLTIPMALAQPVPGADQHPKQDFSHPADNQNHNTQNHDTHTTVQHTTTVQHDTTVQHGTSIVQNGHLTQPSQPGFLPGHSPGDNRLPIYTQGGNVQHESYPAGHSWQRGDRYTGSRQVVSNWSAYHVQRPPSGYEYVRDGNNLVLIAIASGVVASVLANALYQ